MPALYDRKWALSVAEIDLSDLDIAFRVERSTRREPNTAEIRVWNLSPATRAVVEIGGIVVLRAGYADPPMLFRGDSRAIWTTREGSDWITTITARDGGRAYSEARIARSYQAGTSIVSVLEDLVSDLEIGRGNLDEFVSAYTLRNGATTFPDGYVAAGSAARVLSDLVRAAGLRWSVQSGALQIMLRGQAIQTREVVLSADSGMVESPTWDETGTRTRGRRGLLSVKTLIQPGIDPGRRVRVQSALVDGDFEVSKAAYSGDTRGDDWYASLSLRTLGAV